MQASLGHLTLDDASGQAADVGWDIQTDNPATHCMHHYCSTEILTSLLTHMQASLGHLTLDEASGQAADIGWDIQTDNDPATHCMCHYNAQQKF